MKGKYFSEKVEGLKGDVWKVLKRITGIRKGDKQSIKIKAGHPLRAEGKGTYDSSSLCGKTDLGPECCTSGGSVFPSVPGGFRSPQIRPLTGDGWPL